MKDDKKNRTMLRAVGGIGDDLLTEAANDQKHVKSGRKKTLIALLASVLVLSMIAGSVALIFANRPVTEENNTPIVFTGEAYENGAQTELPDALKKVKITVDGKDDRLIGADSVFTIETSEPCDEKTLAEHLSVTPATEFTVKRRNDKTFEIAPAKGKLKVGTIYRLTFGDPEKPSVSYAFQTETELMIKGFIPADMTGNAPINTGIEVVFTEALQSADFGQFIEIAPKISGSFRLYPDGRTVAFVPAKDLDKNTVYTVTVKPGLLSVAGKELKEGQAITFMTAGESSTGHEEQPSYLNVTPNFSKLEQGNARTAVNGCSVGCLFSPGEEAYVRYAVSSSNGFGSIGFHTELYRFPTYENAYQTILEKEKQGFNPLTRSIEYDTDALDKVYSHDGAYDFGSTAPYYAVSFGNELSPGVYLVKLDVTASDAQKRTHEFSVYSILQVSSLRAACVSLQQKILLYALRDDGAALGDAEVSGYVYRMTYAPNNSNVYYLSVQTKPSTCSDLEKIELRTDGGGIGELQTNNKNRGLALLQKDGQTLLVQLTIDETTDQPRCTAFVYSDRSVYFTSDRVNLYGYILPLCGASLPENLYIKLNYGGQLLPVQLGDDGSFTCSYAFEDQGLSYQYFILCDENDRTIASYAVRVTREEKPVISATLTLDAPYVAYKGVLSGKVTASYFDGSPAEGYKFRINESDYFTHINGDFKVNVENNGVTDKNGELRFTVRTGGVVCYSNDPLYFSVSAELADYETQTIVLSQSVPYYHSDKIFRCSVLQNERCVTLNELDLSGFPENVTGAPASGSVTCTLNKTVFTKTDHTGYDPYTKLTYRYSTYISSAEIVKTETLRFENGRIVLPTLDDSGFNGYYTYSVTYSDGRNTFTRSIPAGKFAAVDNSGAPSLELETSKNANETYLPGERIEARCRCGAAYVDQALYVLSYDSIADYRSGNDFAGVYDKKGLSGCYLTAVYYDAESDRFLCQQTMLQCNILAYAGVQISILPDKTGYKPGEQAVITVKVKDGDGAQVLISVVDEACFALGEDRAEPLSSVFGSRNRSPYVHVINAVTAGTGISYGDYRVDGKEVATSIRMNAVQYNMKYSRSESDSEQPNTNNAPSANDQPNGDNGTYLRQLFADNPEFRVITLDENGEGTLIMQVPDNMTSWRITCCAVKGLGGPFEDIRCGKSATDVICTLPFYLVPTMNDTILVGDDFSAGVRAIGAAAAGITVEACLYDHEGKELKALQSSDERPFFNFGKLPEGAYSVIFSASDKENKDAVKRTFTVARRLATADIRKTVTAAELKDIQPMLYPVTLTFIDNSSSFSLYSGALSVLQRNTALRSDAIAAKHIASVYAEAFYQSKSALSENDLRRKLTDYCGSEFSLFPYSDGDTALTAKILSLDPSLVNMIGRTSLVRSYENTLSNALQFSEEKLCATLLALSAIDEPVLNRLYSVSSVAGNYSAEAKLYLAAAFACCGDYPASKQILDGVIKQYAVTDKNFGTMYLNVGTRDENAALTALALLSACRVSRPDAEMLASYMIGDATWTERGSLELASFIKYYLPTEKAEDKTVVIRFGGEEKTLKVNGLRCASVTLDKAGFETFEIVDIDKDVRIRAFYKGSPEEVGDASQSSRVKIEKTVVRTGENVYTVKLRISGTSSRVYERFSISDYIPSGARYLTCKMSSGAYGSVSYGWWLTNTANELSGSFSVYNKSAHDRGDRTTCDEYSFDTVITYTMRGAIPGEYVAESALLLDQTGMWSKAERTTVTVI